MMRVLRSRAAWIAATLGLALAVFALGWPSIPFALYARYSTECPLDVCFPSIPRLALAPFVAALLVQLVVLPRFDWRPALVRGVCLAIIAILYSGLVTVAAIPFHHTYYAGLYRAYAVAYVAGSSATLAFVLNRAEARWSNEAVRGVARPALFLMVAVGISAFVRQEWLVGSAAFGGGVAGVALSRLFRVEPLAHRWLVVAPALVAAIAFLARAVFGLQAVARTGPGMAFAVASDDGDSYYRLAHGLASGSMSPVEVLSAGAFPPLYTTFLASIFVATRESMAAVVLAQALLAAGSAFLIYVIARPIVGVAPSLLAALLFSLDGNLIQNQSTLTAEALLLPLTLLTLLGLARYGERRQVRWILIAAVALGLSFVTRNLVGFVLLGAALAWLFWREARRPKRLLRDAGILCAALVLISLPVGFASMASEGTPRLTTQGAGVAWDTRAGAGYTIDNGFLIDRGIRPFSDPLGSIGRVLADPLPVLGFYATAVPQRLSTLLFFGESGESDPLYIVNPVRSPNAFGDGIQLLRLAGLIVAVIGVVRAPSRRGDPRLAILFVYAALYIALWSAVFAPTHAFRYRIPIEPLRFIAEAAGVLFLVGQVGALLLGIAPRTAAAPGGRAQPAPGTGTLSSPEQLSPG